MRGNAAVRIVVVDTPMGIETGRSTRLVEKAQVGHVWADETKVYVQSRSTSAPQPLGQGSTESPVSAR